jgi:predicted ATPase
MTEPTLLRVLSIQVEALFKLYDHRVDLKLEDRVTILHGPNGVGKTVMLRMVNALLEGRFSYFGKTPFRRFALEFTDGTTVELSEQPKERPQMELQLSLHRGKQSQQASVPADQDISSLAVELASQIPWLLRAEEDVWFDEREGEAVGADEIVARYGGKRLPPGARRQLRDGTEPNWFREFRSKVNAHLIEAQRLLRVTPGEPYRYRRETRMVSTVLDYSQDLHRRISETMARYGRQSQALDQSFPQRLLTAAGHPLEASDLKQRMSELDGKRGELKEIGVLDEPAVHPFDTAALDNLDPTQKRVMTLYVQDTAEKLAALDDLARRTRLLLDNVNRKFRHKRVRIDRDKGLVAEDEGGQVLELDSLSSGEQHELVLHYDLLFRVRPNTLVLIDEPELSLHVAWQKRFLPDLLEIVKTADFDALIATHSPFIVGDRSDLMVPLDTDLE